ncbi:TRANSCRIPTIONAL REGULATORY protein [Enhygromyxa salina]|uniref:TRANSCRIPTIONAL REGULATORY protein n=1 Tax=Enhygromyxa salina TaxID=215803 RepID=A0A0C2D1V1_9BACT|nr:TRANSCRIPTIONAL REGULATORY protein [Enhygromyxa salina]
MQPSSATIECNHRVQPPQPALLDPKTPFDPERVAAVSNNEKRTEDL